MNYRLIMLDKPILVSDEKIKSGDWYFWEGNKNNAPSLCTDFLTEESVLECKKNTDFYKVISADIEGLPKLDLSLIAEKIGWVDVEKLAKEKFPDESTAGWIDSFSPRERRGFIEGFETAQNEKKYTLSELELAVDMAREGIRVTRISEWETEKEFEYSSEQIIRHLSKPKEYLVEVEIGKQMCECAFIGEKDICIYPNCLNPKITNNTITVTKIIK